MDNDGMKPVDGGAPVMIPKGNMNADIPGTYGNIQKMMSNKRKRSKNGISSIPNYKYGYGGACSEFFKSIDGTMSIP